MSKRGAAVQITKDNYDRDDEDRYGPPIIPGTWQSADEETLKKRVIRKAKRPTPSANGSLPLPPANPFGSLELSAGSAPAGAENVVLCISGKSPNLDVVTEWHKTAQALAAAGFAVILPDLHTNDKTKPGVIAVSDALELMCALLDMQGVSATTPAVVMGKSWGGGIATRFAAQHPARVSKLVLVAPSLAPSLDERRTVVASLAQSLFIRLMWAEDDTVVPVDRADAYKEGLDDTRLTFTTTTAGGHRVLDEYVEQVVTWIRK